MRPIQDFLVIEPVETKQSESGYQFSQAKKTTTAQVIAVPDEEDQITAGDTVVYDELMALSLEVSGKSVILIRKLDVFGIL